MLVHSKKNGTKILDAFLSGGGELDNDRTELDNQRIRHVLP